jgi:MFS family permease
MSAAQMASTPVADERVLPRAYAVMVMLFLFQTLNFFDKLVFGLSAGQIIDELHITRADFGKIGSSFFLLFSLTGTLVGLFATKRFKSKWIIAVLALVWSAAQLPIYFTGMFTMLLTTRIILGAGEGPGLPSALHACYDWFPANKRSLPSAVILQGISAGFLIGGPFLNAIILHYGWRFAFLACGVMSIVWLLGWLFIGGTGPYAATKEEAADTSRNVPAAMLWLDPTIVGVMIMSFMSSWVVGMAAVWLPQFLQKGLGYAQSDVGWIISGVFAFQSPLLLAGSWVCQRMQLRGVRPRIALGHSSMIALLASGIALVASVHVEGPLQLALVAIAFAAPSLTTIFGPVLLGAIAPPAQRGVLIVVIYSANATSALLSNYLTGVVVDASGADVHQGFVNAMTMSGIALLIGALSCLLLIFPDRTAARFARYADRHSGSMETQS